MLGLVRREVREWCKEVVVVVLRRARIVVAGIMEAIVQMVIVKL